MGLEDELPSCWGPVDFQWQTAVENFRGHPGSMFSFSLHGNFPVTGSTASFDTQESRLG